MPAPLSLKLVRNKPFVNPDTVIAEVVIPAGYSYTTGVGGAALNLQAAAMSDPQFLGPAGPNSILPDDVEVVIEGGAGIGAQWTMGTNLSNGLLELFSSGDTEQGTGVLGAPFTNSTFGMFLHIHLNPSDR